MFLALVEGEERRGGNFSGDGDDGAPPGDDKPDEPADPIPVVNYFIFVFDSYCDPHFSIHNLFHIGGDGYRINLNDRLQPEDFKSNNEKSIVATHYFSIDFILGFLICYHISVHSYLTYFCKDFCGRQC